MGKRWESFLASGPMSRFPRGSVPFQSLCRKDSGRYIDISSDLSHTDKPHAYFAHGEKSVSHHRFIARSERERYMGSHNPILIPAYFYTLSALCFRRDSGYDSSVGKKCLVSHLLYIRLSTWLKCRSNASQACSDCVCASCRLEDSSMHRFAPSCNSSSERV